MPANSQSPPQQDFPPRRQRYTDIVAAHRSLAPGKSNLTEKGFSPAISLAAVAFATVLALIAAPTYSSGAAQLRTAGMILALGFLTGPAICMFRNPRNLLRTENLIGLAPVYWILLDLVTGTQVFEGVTPEITRWALVTVGLSGCCFWIGTIGKAPSLPKSFAEIAHYKPPPNLLLPMGVTCFLLAMMAFAVPCNFNIQLMFDSLSVGRFAAPWARGKFGGWNAFVDHLTYFGYLLPTVAAMSGRRNGWLSIGTLILVICTGIYCLFLAQSGSRRIIGVCLGAALAYWVLDRDKIKISQVIGSVALIMSLLFFMQVMIIVRSTGMGNIGWENAKRIAMASLEGKDIATGAPRGIAVDDNFYRLSQVVWYVPQKHPYVYWKYPYYVLARPIPRVLWPGKPDTPGFDLQAILGVQASLTCTIIGEFWIIGGLAMTLIGSVLLGRATRITDSLFDVGRGSLAPMFYGYMSMTLFVGYRSMIEIVLFSYALLGWWLASTVISKFR